MIPNRNVGQGKVMKNIKNTEYMWSFFSILLKFLKKIIKDLMGKNIMNCMIYYIYRNVMNDYNNKRPARSLFFYG